MSTTGMQRRQIESHIFALARQVNAHDAGSLDDQAFSDFINAWHNLAQYYERNRDTTLDAHILKLYMRYAVMLRHIIEDQRMAQRRRQQAKSALKDLNQTLDGVFRQIERNGGARAAV